MWSFLVVRDEGEEDSISEGFGTVFFIYITKNLFNV